ncbi:hypothetical protein [Amycolatopsis alba]|uniref:hypothetical protein n=1 Tax=Amycolatopsis alba TaxID=76020 RepID=UPI0011780B00|nr:hypothetical protein [Amycolatopsis alba]
MTTHVPASAIPDADQIRRRRISIAAMPDIWDVAACGLEISGLETHMARLRMGTEGVRANGGSAESEAATYLVREPSYVPYLSTAVLRYESSDNRCREVLDLVCSPEAHAAILSSPIMATAPVVAAIVRQAFWGGPATRAGRGVATLIEILPAKGNEVDRTLREYRDHNAETAQDAAHMAVRNFIGAFAAWEFIRSDGQISELCGSVLCLAMFFDHHGTSDAYIAAASEALACLDGPAATQALRELVTMLAVIGHRNEVTRASARIADLAAFLDASGEPVAPQEFLWARSWDAGMTPYSPLGHGYGRAPASYRRTRRLHCHGKNARRAARTRWPLPLQ